MFFIFLLKSVLSSICLIITPNPEYSQLGGSKRYSFTNDLFQAFPAFENPKVCPPFKPHTQVIMVYKLLQFSQFQSPLTGVSFITDTYTLFVTDAPDPILYGIN